VENALLIDRGAVGMIIIIIIIIIIIYETLKGFEWIKCVCNANGATLYN
jgi:hypothetical protein